MEEKIISKFDRIQYAAKKKSAIFITSVLKNLFTKCREEMNNNIPSEQRKYWVNNLTTIKTVGDSEKEIMGFKFNIKELINAHVLQRDIRANLDENNELSEETTALIDMIFKQICENFKYIFYNFSVNRVDDEITITMWFLRNKVKVKR